MNSVTLISTRLDLFGACRDVLRTEWGDRAADAEGLVQVRDARNRLFTLFDFNEVYWDCFELPAALSEVGTVAACEVECRWLDMFVVVTKQLAESVSPLWIYDDDGVVVDALEVECGGFRL
jgi:hypothetical protein